MKKIEISEIEKDIIERMVKKLSEVKSRNYQIVYREYDIQLQYEHNGTIIPVHSFISDFTDAQKSLFYYLKGAIEN